MEQVFHARLRSIDFTQQAKAQTIKLGAFSLIDSGWMGRRVLEGRKPMMRPWQ